MQKVIRRTLLAERQALRRQKARLELKKKSEANNAREENQFMLREQRKISRAAAYAQKEDYALGPLAPKRDVGSARFAYGAVSGQLIRGTDLIEGTKRMEAFKKEVEGFGLDAITEGDRVVIIEGRDKGRISTVESIDKEKGEVTVKGVNLIDATIPKSILPMASQGQYTETIEKPVPLTTIRLIHPLTNNETGEIRDVIVKRLVKGKLFVDRHSGITIQKRYIPLPSGKLLWVPWPAKEPISRPEYDGDTLRLEVEQKTFVPTLLGPPMPGSIIDELRNKYSVFRTRHEPEYIEKKKQEDIEEEKKKRLDRLMVRTPLKEINRKERKLRRAKGKGTLTKSMLERIGWVVDAKRQLALKAAGLSSGDVEATRQRIAA